MCFGWDTSSGYISGPSDRETDDTARWRTEVTASPSSIITAPGYLYLSFAKLCRFYAGSEPVIVVSGPWVSF